jgi:hypothetical protein
MNTGFGLPQQPKVVIRAHLRQRPKSCLCRYLLGRLRKSGRLPALAFGFPRKRQARRASPQSQRGRRTQHGVSALSFLHHLSVGSPPRPIFFAPAFTHPLQSSFPLEAPLNGANGTQAISLCYINAVASSLQVHGDSSRDGSGRSLDTPEGQCSIGFQPVFCSHVEDVPRC